MDSQHTLNATVIHIVVIAYPNHTRKLSIGEGMGHGQSEDLLLHIEG